MPRIFEGSNNPTECLELLRSKALESMSISSELDLELADTLKEYIHLPDSPAQPASEVTPDMLREDMCNIEAWQVPWS